MNNNTMQVLLKLRQLISYVKENPSERYPQLLEEIEKMKCDIYHAIRDAIIPELRDYIDTVVNLIAPGTQCNIPTSQEKDREMEEANTRTESKEAQESNGVLQEDSREEPG